MANRIQLRHGSSAPTVNDLLPFELGWDGDSLYIHNGKNTPAIICIGGAGMSISANSITGTLGVAHGGTGQSTLTLNAILYGNSANGIGQLPSASGAVYATVANGSLSFGTLPVAQGGTGITTVNSHRILIGPSSNNSTAAPTWRELEASDIPSLNSIYLPLTGGGNITGNVSVSGSISANTATIGNCAVIRDSSTTARKIYTYTTQPTQQEIDAMSDGDLVLIKVS